MEVTGKIKVIRDEQQVSASFRKRELVVETDEQYPQFISINFVQDKCDILSARTVGEVVKVSINLRGREWVNPEGETKYFNDIQGWRIEKVADSFVPHNGSAVDAYNAASAPATDEAPKVNEEEHDDLTF